MVTLNKVIRPAKTIGYARVSAKSQDTDIQIKCLKRLGCTDTYKEKISGHAANDRTILNKMIKHAIEGDTIIVMKLDRLARNTIDALKIIHTLTAKKVSLKIFDIGGGIDLTTDTGRLMVTVLAAVARIEHKRIYERARAGITQAALEGRHPGRPKNKHTEEILKLKNKGLKQIDIVKQLKVSKSVVSRIFNRDKAAA